MSSEPEESELRETAMVAIVRTLKDRALRMQALSEAETGKILRLPNGTYALVLACLRGLEPLVITSPTHIRVVCASTEAEARLRGLKRS